MSFFTVANWHTYRLYIVKVHNGHLFWFRVRLVEMFDAQTHRRRIGGSCSYWFGNDVSRLGLQILKIEDPDSEMTGKYENTGYGENSSNAREKIYIFRDPENFFWKANWYIL